MDKMEVLDIIREERKQHTNLEYDYDEEDFIEHPKIKYIKQVTTTANFSKAFVTAFAARLAAEACYALTTSKTMQEQKFKEYEVKLAQSKTADAHEGGVSKIESSTWITDST